MFFKEFNHFFRDTGPDDSSSGTSDFNETSNVSEPDDCYCESATNRSNTVYTKDKDIKKINDFPFKKVYFGSPNKMPSTMKLDGPLFVTPYIGLASIFAVRPQNMQKYGVPRGVDYNRDYDEWKLPFDKLKKPLKELHVWVEGKGINIKPVTEDVSGYVYTIDITPEIKDHIYQSSKMDKEREFCIDKIDSVSFSSMEKVDIKMTVDSREPKPVQESADITSGVDFKLLTEPSTIELFNKYKKFGPHFYYCEKTRNEVGPLPDNVERNYFALVDKLTKDLNITYDEYSKYLTLFYKILDIPKGSTIKDCHDLAGRPEHDGRRRSLVRYRENKLAEYNKTDKLFHTSDKSGLTKLKPQFRSISVHGEFGANVEALFPEPRVYFGHNVAVSRMYGRGITEKGALSIYEYSGPAENIKSLYVDQELGGAAVYVNTSQELPVKELSWDEYTKERKPENVQESYSTDEINLVQESKMPAKKRNSLKNGDFGLVYKDANGKTIRKYPLNDKAHVASAARLFGHCPDKYKKRLANKILRKAHEYGMDTSGWDTVNKAAKD